MKLIIDVPDEAYRARQHWVANSQRMIDEVDIAIANGTPYNPTGDCISRSWVAHNVLSLVDAETRIYAEARLDNAPTVEPRDNFDLGYAKGLEDARAKGRWTFDEKGYFYCDQCGKYPYDQYATTDFCPKCGADMRKAVRNEHRADT